MVDVRAFLEKVEEIRNEKPKYRKGGYGADGTCDCIGLVMGAIRRAGGKWPGTHGSNYAARNEMVNLRNIINASDLELGELVYKAYNEFDDDWDLPAGYSKDEDQRDYYHVGVVTSVNPLVITHCTSPTVKQDKKIGGWMFAGKLKKVDYEGGGTMAEEQKAATVDRPAGVEGETVNLREGPGKEYGRIAKIAFGTDIKVLKDLGEWCYIIADGKTGYMQSNFILYTLEPDTEDNVPDGLTQGDIDKLQDALARMDEARDILAYFVGRG